MRIALVTPYDLAVPGGVAEHVWNLSKHLAGRGHDVHIVAPMSRRMAIAGVALHGVATVLAPVQSNGSTARISLSPFAAVRVAGVLKGLRADVVHVHEPAVPVIGLAAVVATALMRRAGLSDQAAVVATFHAARETGWSPNVVARKALGQLAECIDRRIAVSDVARSTAQSYLTQSSDRSATPAHEAKGIEVIPNGVDVAAFRSANDVPEAMADGRPCVLFLGRLDPRKGLAVLVEAFARNGDLRSMARLVVAGPYSHEDATAWRSLCDRDGVTDVRFVGVLDRLGRAAYLRHAAVTCAPATSGESHGVVLLEAMAAGSPVVAAANPGYRLVIADGINGVAVEPGDPTALGEAIVRVLRDPALGRCLSAAGLETAWAHDWSRVAERIVRVYGEAVCGNSPVARDRETGWRWGQDQRSRGLALAHPHVPEMARSGAQSASVASRVGSDTEGEMVGLAGAQ